MPDFNNEQFKYRKTKRAVEHTPFLKKIATYQSVSQCMCEIVKLSGFERPQKKGNILLRFLFTSLLFHNISPCS
jgi:hypothetical protein